MIRHRFFFKNIQKEEDWINRFVAQGVRPYLPTEKSNPRTVSI